MKNLKSLLLIASIVPSLGTLAQIEEYKLPDGKVVKIDRSVFPDLRYDATPKAKPADYVARRKDRTSISRPSSIRMAAVVVPQLVSAISSRTR